jgi:hypothetical protein
LLEDKYRVTPSIVDSEMSVKFVEPQMIETKSEKLANAKSKIDLGIADAVSVLAEVDQISEDMAIEKIESLELRKIERLTKIAGTGQDAQKTALNGAQVGSLVEIVSKVAAGLLPYDSALSMVVRSFNVTDDEAKEIIGTAGRSFKIDPSLIGGNSF